MLHWFLSVSLCQSFVPVGICCMSPICCCANYVFLLLSWFKQSLFVSVCPHIYASSCSSCLPLTSKIFVWFIFLAPEKHFLLLPLALICWRKIYSFYLLENLPFQHVEFYIIFFQHSEHFIDWSSSRISAERSDVRSSLALVITFLSSTLCILCLAILIVYFLFLSPCGHNVIGQDAIVFLWIIFCHIMIPDYIGWKLPDTMFFKYYFFLILCQLSLW